MRLNNVLEVIRPPFAVALEDPRWPRRLCELEFKVQNVLDLGNLRPGVSDSDFGHYNDAAEKGYLSWQPLQFWKLVPPELVSGRGLFPGTEFW